MMKGRGGNMTDATNSNSHFDICWLSVTGVEKFKNKAVRCVFEKNVWEIQIFYVCSLSRWAKYADDVLSTIDGLTW